MRNPWGLVALHFIKYPYNESRIDISITDINLLQ